MARSRVTPHMGSVDLSLQPIQPIQMFLFQHLCCLIEGVSNGSILILILRKFFLFDETLKTVTKSCILRNSERKFDHIC